MRQRRPVDISARSFARSLRAGCVAMLLALVGANPGFAQDRVVFLLPAPPFLPAFSPYTVALRKGYYKAEGIEVELRAVGGGAEVAARLQKGEGDAGGGTGDTAILMRPQGAFVRTIAILGGRALTQLVMRRDSAVYSANELRGKRVSVISTTDSTYYALLGFLTAAGINRDDITIVPGGPIGVYRNVIEKKADVMAGVPDWIPPFRAAGVDIAVMQVGRFFPSTAQAILASDARIKQRPQQIGAFVRGTLRGLREVMSDPAAAAALVASTYEEQHKKDPASVRETIEYYAKNVYPGQRVLGEINEPRLAQLQEFYLAQGIIAQASPVKDLYTNQFVPR